MQAKFLPGGGGVLLDHRKDGKVYFGDIDISASTPPTDVKFVPKCLFSGVLRYDIEFYLRGCRKKNLKIKIYPPCFEKVFIRKISLRGLQWYIFSLVYPCGVGEIND